MLSKCLGGVWTRRLVCLLLSLSMFLAYTPVASVVYADEDAPIEVGADNSAEKDPAGDDSMGNDPADKG